MPIKAVFFDLGETLIDEGRMWREWAACLGVPADDFLSALDEVIARGEHHRHVFECFRSGFDFEAARRERLANGTAYVYRREDLYPDAASTQRPAFARCVRAALSSRSLETSRARRWPICWRSTSMRI